MAAQLKDVRLPEQYQRDLLVEIPDGHYCCRVAQMFDPGKVEVGRAGRAKTSCWSSAVRPAPRRRGPRSRGSVDSFADRKLIQANNACPLRRDALGVVQAAMALENRIRAHR